MRLDSAVALLVSVVAVGCCPDLDVSAAALAARGAPIVGGKLYAGLPAVGALYEDGEIACTATVIGPRTLLSAAHCLDGVSARSLQFVIGKDASSPEYVLDIADLRPHPSYDPDRASNDIGLLTLAEEAPVEPLPVLERRMDASWVGTALLFVGYGTTGKQAWASAGKKRMVKMEISYVSRTTFDYEVPGKNTCFGDSGGPAFFLDEEGQHWVAGVTSYGDESCEEWGVDTRVDAYRGFLDTRLEPVQNAQ